MKKFVALTTALAICSMLLFVAVAEVTGTVPDGWQATGRSTLYNTTVSHDTEGITFVQDTPVQHSGLVYLTKVNMNNTNTVKFKFNQLPELYAAAPNNQNGLYITLSEEPNMFWFGIQNQFATIGKTFSIQISDNGTMIRGDFKKIPAAATFQNWNGGIGVITGESLVADTENTLTITPDGTLGYIVSLNGNVFKIGGTDDLPLTDLSSAISGSTISNLLYFSIGVNTAATVGTSVTITEVNGVSMKVAAPTAEATATPTVEATATPTVEATATPTVEATATPTTEAVATTTPVVTEAPQPIDEWVESGWPEATGDTSQTTAGLKIKNLERLPYGLVYNNKLDIEDGFSLNITLDKITGYYGDATDADSNARYYVLSIGSNNKIFRYSREDHDGHGLAIIFRPIIAKETDPNDVYINIVNYYIPGLLGAANNADGTGYGFSPPLATKYNSFKQGQNYKLEFKPDSTSGYALYINGTKITKVDGTPIDLNFLKGAFTNDEVYVSFAAAGLMEATITKLNNVSLGLSSGGDTAPETSDSAWQYMIVTLFAAAVMTLKLRLHKSR